MDKKRTYYGFTTMQQRQLLFKTWEETGSVTKVCRDQVAENLAAARANGLTPTEQAYRRLEPIVYA